MHLRSYSSGGTTKFLTWTWTWAAVAVGGENASKLDKVVHAFNCVSIYYNGM